MEMFSFQTMKVRWLQVSSVIYSFKFIHCHSHEISKQLILIITLKRKHVDQKSKMF